MSSQAHSATVVDLSLVETCKLVDELERREGVESVRLSPYSNANVSAEGPAVVLVVTD